MYPRLLPRFQGSAARATAAITDPGAYCGDPVSGEQAKNPVVFARDNHSGPEKQRTELCRAPFSHETDSLYLALQRMSSCASCVMRYLCDYLVILRRSICCQNVDLPVSSVWIAFNSLKQAVACLHFHVLSNTIALLEPTFPSVELSCTDFPQILL